VAYVFIRSGTVWIQQQVIGASDGGVTDEFGAAVSLSGETAAVGAPSHSGPGGMVSAGTAYVFVRSGGTWSEQQKLAASDAASLDKFGWAISVSGDTVAVGAVWDDTPAGANAGSGYVFVRSGTTWTEQRRLLAPDGAAGDEFGAAISVAADTVVAGSRRDDTAGGADAGSAHVFRGPVPVTLESFTLE
jgi:hypothetical protein